MNKVFDDMIKADVYHHSVDAWTNFKAFEELKAGQHNYKGEIFVVWREPSRGTVMGESPERAHILRVKLPK